MKSYWVAFLDKYPWMVEAEVIHALEAFWYFSNGYDTEIVNELCNKYKKNNEKKL